MGAYYFSSYISSNWSSRRRNSGIKVTTMATRIAASTIFFDPRYTGAVMLAAILVAIVVTLIPLLRRRDDQFEEMYDKK